MRFSKKSQPEDVYEWIIIATRNIVPSAQERIWKEILAHYRESVAAHQSEGSTETEASEMALRELGDPHVARKQFCQTCLLETEARYLARISDPNGLRSFAQGCCLLFLLWICGPLWLIKKGALHGPHEWFELLATFLCLVVVPTASHLASKGKTIRDMFWLRFFGETVGALGIALGMISFFSQAPFKPLRWIINYPLWLYLVAFAVDLWVRKRIWNKLGNPPSSNSANA